MTTPDCADVTEDGRVYLHWPDEDCLNEDRLRRFDRYVRETPEAFRARVERAAAEERRERAAIHDHSPRHGAVPRPPRSGSE